MTGKDFLAQAAGTMAANHLREIAEWMDKCAELEAENAALKGEIEKAKKPNEAAP